MNEEIEVRGTFACPICGFDKPHSHSEDEQRAYREDQVRNDGWTSTVKLSPKESGWYLCLGVEIPRRDPETVRGAQLFWFLWVRQGAARDSESRIPEVLYYSRLSGQWSLRNLLGNAVRDGSEARWEVVANPRYWRDVPALGAVTVGAPQS